MMCYPVVGLRLLGFGKIGCSGNLKMRNTIGKGQDGLADLLEEDLFEPNSDISELPGLQTQEGTWANALRQEDEAGTRSRRAL